MAKQPRMLFEEYMAARRVRNDTSKAKHGKKWKRKHKERYWVGIDGEGETIGQPWALDSDTNACIITGDKHLYTSISWRDVQGRGKTIADPDGLSTLKCLEFITAIPPDAKIMAYGFGYDLTKILEDLPTDDLYRLSHPHTRKASGQGRERYLPIFWRGYFIDLFNTRFRVARAKLGRQGDLIPDRWRTVYDISKFYQCPFVTAVERWDIGNEPERAAMRKMKDDRRNLGNYTAEQVLAYNSKECIWGAELAQKLDDAHKAIGIKLGTQYYGAGSTAKALMKKWGVRAYVPGQGDNPELPREVELAAAYAFFGGRFEISRRGKVQQTVYDLDIASAYPYQIAFLPCLICGKWTLTKDIERVKEAQAAIVRYSLTPLKGGRPVWGPFPFRDVDGTIPFPVESDGGWVYKDEYLAGARIFPNVRFHEAWVYETRCRHQPFTQIPSIYLERLRIGKEAAGIVLKLGTNAVAGSIMQTVGERKYYCSVWAGMITSGTRAQNLELMGQYERLEDLIMIATDGQWGLKLPSLPEPRDTGTSITVIDKTTGKPTFKPLGSWEKGVFEEGVFMARPGIYFPLGIKNEKGMKDLKARGIGVRTLYEHREQLMEWYESSGGFPYQIYDKDPFRVISEKTKPAGIERFMGLRGGIITTQVANPEPGHSSWIAHRRSVYGLWSLQRRQISFESRPKRNEGDGYHLETRSMPRGQFTCAYERGKFALDDLMKEVNFGDLDDDQPDFT
jgi:hypothetical protein